MERIFAFVSITMFSACLCVLAFWQFIDLSSPPMTISESRTDKAVYRQGETMVVTRMLCLNTDREYVVSRSFVDHIVFQLANFPTQSPQLGCHLRSIGIEIPPSLPPGFYTYRVFATFRNPLRTVRVDFPDLPAIEVVAKSG